MIKAAPVLLSNKCPQWLLPGNHNSIANLQILVSISKRLAGGSRALSMAILAFKEDSNGPALVAAPGQPAVTPP